MPPWRILMRTGSGQAGDSPAAGRPAEPAIGFPFAATRWVAWHSDLAAWVDRLGWLRTLSDWLTGVLGPFRERHQDNLVLGLLHGGRWVGHPLHPALRTANRMTCGNIGKGVMVELGREEGPAATVDRPR